MLENIPSQSTMTELIGQSLFEVWQALCSAIDEKYDMERLWNTCGKNWTYEYKYRRGGKTLCGRVRPAAKVRRVRPAAEVRRVRPAAAVRVCYSEVTASTSSMVEKSRSRGFFRDCAEQRDYSVCSIKRLQARPHPLLCSDPARGCTIDTRMRNRVTPKCNYRARQSRTYS